MFRPYVPGAPSTERYRRLEAAGLADTTCMPTQWFVYYVHIEQLYFVYGNLGGARVGSDALSCPSVGQAALDVEVEDDPTCRPMNVWNAEFVEFPTKIARFDWNGLAIADRRSY